MFQSFRGKNSPSARPAVNSWLDAIGRAGLYVFFLSFQLNTTVAYLGLLLMLLVFALQPARWMPLLKRESTARVFLVLALYILLYSIWAAHEFPQSAADQWTALTNWMHWLIFIPVAWQVFLDAKNINRLLLILAGGVMIRILTHLEWSHLLNLFAWERTGFGYSEIVIALILGIVSLGMLLLAPRMILPSLPARKSIRIARFSLWLTGLIIFLEALVLSQTRSAWLSGVIVFPVALAACYWDWLKDHAFRSFRGAAVLALVLLLAGLFVARNSAPIVSRLQAEPEAVEQIAKGNLEVPKTISIWTRLQLWRIGLRLWEERPLFGWGPGTTRLLLERSTTDTYLSSHAHLHSLYLEILVRFGVLGGLLFGALIALLLNGVRKAYANGLIPWDYACFLFGGWAFTALFMIFDFQIFKYVWRNYCVLWAALTYAVQMENVSRLTGARSVVGRPSP